MCKCYCNIIQPGVLFSCGSYSSVRVTHKISLAAMKWSWIHVVVFDWHLNNSRQLKRRFEIFALTHRAVLSSRSSALGFFLKLKIPIFSKYRHRILCIISISKDLAVTRTSNMLYIHVHSLSSKFWFINLSEVQYSWMVGDQCKRAFKWCMTNWLDMLVQYIKNTPRLIPYSWCPLVTSI